MYTPKGNYMYIVLAVKKLTYKFVLLPPPPQKKKKKKGERGRQRDREKTNKTKTLNMVCHLAFIRSGKGPPSPF